VERYVQKIIIHPDRIEVKLNFDIRTGCFEEEIKKEPLNHTDQSEHSKELFLPDDTTQRRVFDGGERVEHCQGVFLLKNPLHIFSFREFVESYSENEAKLKFYLPHLF
jgi:hypothetical protein